MNIHVMKDAHHAAALAAEHVRIVLAQKPDALLCMAAGHASLPVFDALTGVDFSRAYFVDMDEWTGCDEGDDGSCAGFLQRNFLNRTNMPEEHICLFRGKYRDATAECKRIKAFIAARGGIDYMLLGLGMNGHLALNEPGCASDSPAREQRLDENTRAMMQKYFAGTVEIRSGVTLGMADLLAVKQADVLIVGEHKRKILRCVFSGEEPFLPATMLRDAPGGMWICDRAAWGEEE